MIPKYWSVGEIFKSHLLFNQHLLMFLIAKKILIISGYEVKGVLYRKTHDLF